MPPGPVHRRRRAPRRAKELLLPTHAKYIHRVTLDLSRHWHRWLLVTSAAALVACGSAGSSYGVGRPAAIVAQNSTATPALQRVYRCRLYVDHDYRQQNQDFETRLRALVDRANQVLRPDLGVALEVDSIRAWDHSGGDGESLLRPLAQLRDLDASSEVDWVVGMVGGQDYSPEYEDMLAAPAASRYLVVRGADSGHRRPNPSGTNGAGNGRSESQSDGGRGANGQRGGRGSGRGGGARGMSPVETAKLSEDRRMHKELALFLHAWAHSLLVPHTVDSSSVMASRYDVRASSLGSDALILLPIGLRHRDQQVPAELQAWAREIEATLPTLGLPAQDPATAQFRSWLDQAKRGEVPVPPVEHQASAATIPTLTASEQDELQAVTQRVDAGKLDAAWAQLQPLLSHQPRQPLVQELACRIESGRNPLDGAARARCQQACYMASRATPCALAALTIDVRKEAPAARSLLDRAWQHLQAAAMVDAGDCQNLATALAQMGRLAEGERAAQFLGPTLAAMQLRGQIMVLRRWRGLPAGTLSDDDEPQYVALQQRAHDEVEHGHGAAALAELQRQWPRLPGTLATRAAGARMAHNPKEAFDLAQQSLAAWPEAIGGHLALGLLRLDAHDGPGALPHLQRAFELDPANQSLKSLLARAQPADAATPGR